MLSAASTSNVNGSTTTEPSPYKNISGWRDLKSLNVFNLSFFKEQAACQGCRNDFLHGGPNSTIFLKLFASRTQNFEQLVSFEQLVNLF